MASVVFEGGAPCVRFDSLQFGQAYRVGTDLRRFINGNMAISELTGGFAPPEASDAMVELVDESRISITVSP